MTTNYQIENYFKKNPSKNFKGVYASNEISSLKLPKNSSIIVNYSPKYARGSHWIAMKHLNDKKQPPEYFDSYGFIPDHDDKIIGVKTNFKDFLEDHNLSDKPIKYNNLDLQGYGSDVCGEYSTYFIKNGLPSNKKWKEIKDLPTPEERDKKIRELVKIRPSSKGFLGDGLARADAFWEYLNPRILKVFSHDENAPLSLYFGLNNWTQSSTKRQIVEYQKLLPHNFPFMMDWMKVPLSERVKELPDRSGYKGLFDGFFKSLNDTTINKQLKKDKKSIMKIYNNLKVPNKKLDVLELFDNPHLDEMAYKRQLQERKKGTILI